MTFVETTDAMRNLAQVFAVVVGGSWAYVKFIRGRTFRRRGELSVRGTVLATSHGRAILVRVSFENTGLSMIKFEAPSQKGVFAYELPPGGWRPELEANVSWGKDVMRSTVFTDHHWVEPGESIRDEVLLPVGPGAEATLAYQVVAKVTVAGRRLTPGRFGHPEWTARTVIPVAMDVIGASQAESTDSENARNAVATKGE